MSQPGTRIGVVTSIAASSGPAGTPEALPTGALTWQSVTIDDGPGHLYYRPGDESASALDFDLNQSRRLQYPTYLEFFGDRLRRIRIPKIGRVTELKQLEGGILRVGLSSSAKTMTVLPTAPGAARIRQVCQVAFDERRGIVVIDEEHGPAILDADFAVGSSATWVGSSPVAQPTVTPDSLPSTTRAAADQAFAALATKICDTSLDANTIAGSDCIAYNGAAGSCHILAQATCEYLAAQHIPAQKTWLFGNTLRLKTRNSPSCYFDSTWHVAVSVRVIEGGVVHAYVLDPSAASGVIAYADWVARFGSHVTGRTWTDVSTYTLNAQGQGVAFSAVQFEQDLSILRWNLAHNTPRPPFACSLPAAF